MLYLMILSFSIPSYWEIFVVFAGFLFGVRSSLAYVKGVRGDGKRYKLSEVLVSSVFFGASGVLLVYILSKEIRLEDKLGHRKFLFINIGLFLLQALLVFLLAYFKIVK